MMLGRVGMALNNATTATQAFAHAYQLIRIVWKCGSAMLRS